MGLFSSKSKKNFFDLLGIKIDSSIESKLMESEKTDKFTDYTCDIQENFKLVDSVTLRFFGQKKDLSGNESFNIVFQNKGQSITINKVKEIVNAISNEYGKDRNGNSKWTNDDDKSISTYWEGREWIIDQNGNSHNEHKENCAQVNFLFSVDDGIDFSVLGAHNLIKK